MKKSVFPPIISISHLKVVSRSPVKLEDRLVKLRVTKSSPMLPKSREISRAWVPLQRLKSTQFSITTKASFRLSKRFPSISGSGADLARLILNLPPVKAAMMAAREFSRSPICAERAHNSTQSWLEMNSGQH